MILYHSGEVLDLGALSIVYIWLIDQNIRSHAQNLIVSSQVKTGVETVADEDGQRTCHSLAYPRHQ